MFFFHYPSYFPPSLAAIFAEERLMRYVSLTLSRGKKLYTNLKGEIRGKGNFPSLTKHSFISFSDSSSKYLHKTCMVPIGTLCVCALAEIEIAFLRTLAGGERQCKLIKETGLVIRSLCIYTTTLGVIDTIRSLC